MRRKLWSYYCPLCEEGFGDLEGEVIKKIRGGLGGLSTLIACPRCGKWVVLGDYMTVDEFNPEEDTEFWNLTDEQLEQARRAGYSKENEK